MNQTGKQVLGMLQRRVAYATFERLILDLYEQKSLTLDLLNHIARQYRLLGADNAGSRYLRARDGKDAQQICIELVDPTFPIVARGSSEDNEEYWERELKKWEEIMHQRWGWQGHSTPSPQSQCEIAA